MDSAFFTHAPASRARLDEAFEAAPLFLRPMIEAVRNYGCGMLTVGQTKKPFRLPGDRPAIVIVGDDTDRALGPKAFNFASMRRVVRDCHAFAVVSCEPLPAVYACVASSAVLLRQNVMLVETRPEQEEAWSSLIHKLAPDRPLLRALVKEARP
ncbi:hypothetical protein [Sphingobium phenoxybenzoativorans]|uniref:hypothetical protein n=1 Tax=Sphingobium phenoxybenzoativorans TaxID=1592790 RepID=UPI0008729582|nr:hypothetical protein [Sphingobium phenoxybenzoativorans]